MLPPRLRPRINVPTNVARKNDPAQSKPRRMLRTGLPDVLARLGPKFEGVVRNAMIRRMKMGGSWIPKALELLV